MTKKPMIMGFFTAFAKLFENLTACFFIFQISKRLRDVW